MKQYTTLEKKFTNEVLPELKAAYKKLLIAMPELEGIVDEIIAEGELILLDFLVRPKKFFKINGPDLQLKILKLPLLLTIVK